MTAYPPGAYIHMILCTEGRQPIIGDDLAPALYERVAEIVRKNRAIPIAVGGMEEHIHVLSTLSFSQSVEDAVRSVMNKSAAWVRETFPDNGSFAWHEGYAAFGLGNTEVEELKRYIADQKELHRTMTFEEEFIRFLKENGIEYDEEHLWE